MRLEGYKAIASAVESVWRVCVSKDSAWRYAHAKDDPLPVQRLRRRRGVVAEPEAVRAWAERNAPTERDRVNTNESAATSTVEG